MGLSLLCMMGFFLLSTVICGNAEAPPEPTVTLQPSTTQIYRVIFTKPKAELRADRTAVPVGGSVTLTCSVNPSSYGWKYYWYRDGKSYQPVTNEQISVSEGGRYSCRGGRGEPVYYTEWSQPVWIDTTVSNRPVVTLHPNWSEIYRGETITVRCEIHGGDTEWDYEWETNSMIKPPNQNEYRIISASSSNSENYRCKGRMKSSQHETTEWSDSVTLTVSDNEPRPVLTVSPSWLSPGASVTLNCEVEHPSAGWSFYWYKAVPDLSEKSSSYELLPDGSGTAQDSYIIHGQTHTAGYVCRAGRGDPEYHTDHSQPKFVWSADVHSAASLTVSPDRVQHFTSDSVSLTCEGNFTEWRVRKFSEDGRLSDCWRMTGSTCDINTSKSDTGVYWCESGSGEFSSAVNITVQNDGNGPILVSPVHPVTEGASVSLSCSLRTQKILSNVFFYHNDKLIENDPRGELKISAVSKSDEGFYKCQYSGRESAQSWMSVKVTVSGADSSSSPVWLMVGLVCGVSLIIILLLLLYRCRQSKYSCFTRSIQSESHSPGSSTNHGVNQDETHVYGSLQHGTADVYESVTQVTNRNDSCFTRSIQSESHSPGSSTNHGVNQNETHEYNSLQHGTADVYESVTQVTNRNDSCFTRSIQSESHSPGSSTNHGVNQNETHVYGSLQHGTADVYESVTQVKNRNGSDEYDDITSSLIEFKDLRTKSGTDTGAASDPSHTSLC
ncbi:obscurin-like isoform X1 [Astatotilapia calliptera]|uniref:obscurin-like isoform X1 n=1 Tax=Astatotilapia calliptera TaxID=8154 RepID=UPI000E3FFDCF|nr:obscurin-like isoform X1 [Astatotilapia calliptera]